MLNPESSVPKIWLWTAVLVVLTVVLLNGWMSDDAYITFRTVFNFTEGFGPVFNVGERVQTFTNPLWMLLMSGVYFFTGEAYFTAMALSMVLCLGGLWLMQGRVFEGKAEGIWVMALLVLSRSFIEYSTSGLENVLNFFLLMLFLSVWLGNRWSGRKQLLLLALIAGFGMVSRMDTALVYAPAVFVAWWRIRSLRNLGTVFVGLLPFVLWEVFSVIYYGFPFPNTAYAKLNSGLEPGFLMKNGLYYYLNCLNRDPLTLAVIAGGLASLLVLPKRKWLPIGLGVMFYLLYLLRIGGDFMGGRFFYLPVVICALMLGRAISHRPAIRWAWIPLLLIGLLNLRGPLYNWAREDLPRNEKIDAHGIADERAWYLPASALVEWNDSIWVADLERKLDARRHDTPGERLLDWEFIGFTGYGAGPGMHVVDRLALADPLLSRLPMATEKDYRIGHYPRAFPRGYRRSLKIQANDLEDPKLREYLDKLWMVVRGPIWSSERWNTIWKFNMGHYDHLIDRDFYRKPSQTQANLSEFRNSVQDSASFMSLGQTLIYEGRPLRIELEDRESFPSFTIELYGPHKYLLRFWKGRKLLDSKVVHPTAKTPYTLLKYKVSTPKKAMTGRFDAITVESKEECGYFSIGQLLPGEE